MMIGTNKTSFRFLALAVFAVVMLVGAPNKAQAACTGPTGAAGDIIYNTDNSVLQYCNDSIWIGMGGGNGGGAALLLPTSMPDIIYCGGYFMYKDYEDGGTSTRYDNPQSGSYLYYINATGAKGSNTGAPAAACPANLSTATKYNFGGGAGGGGAISSLSDVAVSSLATGQVLKWNATSSKWENGTAAAATANVGYVQIAGAGNTLTDSGTTAGQQLFWDATNKRLGVGTATPGALVQIRVGADKNIGFNTDTSVGTTEARISAYNDAVSASSPLWINGSYIGFQNNGADVMRLTGNAAVIGATAANASALLDVSSTSKGFLPPRMTGAQRDAIATPAPGLTLYNTSTNELNIYNGTSWNSTAAGTIYSADLTSGMTIAGTFTYVGSGAIGNAGLIDNTASAAADPGGANTNQYFSVDFGVGVTKNIRRLTLKTAATGGYANAITYNFDYSDNNSTWTTLGTFVVPAGTGTTYTFDFASGGAHRYWRGKYLSGTTAGNTWVEEIEMMDLTSAGGGGGSLSFPLLATPVGSASAPSYSFTGDSNTGMYSDTADVIKFTAGGTPALELATTASGINYLRVTPGTATTSPTITNVGASTAGTSSTGLPLGINIFGRNATTDGQGGEINIKAGATVSMPLDYFAAAAVRITGGDSTAISDTFGGSVILRGGTSLTRSGGSIDIAGGSGIDGSSVFIAGGAGSNGVGGSITLTATNGTGTASNGGNITVKAGNEGGTGTTGVIDLQSGVKLSADVSPTALAASQDNYAPSNMARNAVLRLTASTPVNITGLAGGTDGRLISIFNIGANAITLKDDNASSTAGNRFALTSDLVLATDQGATLIYDSTTQRWRGVGTVGSGGGSATPAGTVAGALQFRGATAVLAADDVNLIWDDTNDRLGIGVAVPVSKLHVSSTTSAPLPTIAAWDNGSAGALVAIDSTAAHGVNEGGGIVFRAMNPVASMSGYAGIRGGVQTAANYLGYLSFLTRDNAAFATERMRIDGYGNVGIGMIPVGGAADPKLQVAGAIVSNVNNASAATAINFATSNVAYTSAACGAFTLSNMADGGSYSLIVKGNGVGPATFTHSGLTPKSTGTLTCAANKHTVFSFIRAGTDFYVTMITGY